MPDHIHIETYEMEKVALGRVMYSYAQWRNARRGDRGIVWEQRHQPERILDEQHGQRTQRYIYLNPCRKGLVHDPLAWPFSSYHDDLGLTPFPLRSPVADPHAFHAYVSSDPSTKVTGSFLPTVPRGEFSLDAVEAAVSALTRFTLDDLRRDGAARGLLLRSARHLTTLPTAQIARRFQVGEATVRRCASTDAGIHRVLRVVHDPRFRPLCDEDLRFTLSFRAYRTRS